MGSNGNGNGNGKNGKFTAAQVIEHIPGTGGIVNTLAKRLGCDWRTAKRYVTEYPTVRAVYLDECEAAMDMAESVLMRSIQGGDIASAKWYLDRKRKEIYSLRQEVQLDIGQLNEMTDAELLAIIES